MLLRDWARLKVRIYDAAWQKVRKSRPGHNALSDPFLWHDFFEKYVNALPLGGPLVETHLRILAPIAGKMAHRRFPMRAGGKHAWDGQHDIIHELAATGALGMLEAVGHFDSEKGAFSTIANFWIRKRIREGFYRQPCVFGIEGLVQPLYRPKRHVATFAIGLTGTKTVNQSEDDGGDYEIDLLDSEGRTGRKYLQRDPIGCDGARFLWRDEGTYAEPRLKLPGHIGGRASDELVEPELKASPTDQIELPAAPVERKYAFCAMDMHWSMPTNTITAHGGGVLFFPYGPSMKQAEMPAEICYLAKPGRAHFNSWDFTEVSEWEPPKPEDYRSPNVRYDPEVFVVEHSMRFKGRVLPVWVEPAPLERPTTFEGKFGRPWKAGKEWRKPSFEEHVRYALAA